jgi:hypothetical protein
MYMQVFVVENQTYLIAILGPATGKSLTDEDRLLREAAATT